VRVKLVGASQFYTLREEDYVNHIEPLSAANPDPMDSMPPTVVPLGHYFVLGDNREDSRDSREWGPVPEDCIRGKALMVYWSVSPPEDETPPRGPMASFLESASATFTRTRWERTFHVVR
jgi:Signal peptidase, peptidase S26